MGEATLLMLEMNYYYLYLSCKKREEKAKGGCFLCKLLQRVRELKEQEGMIMSWHIFKT